MKKLTKRVLDSHDREINKHRQDVGDNILKLRDELSKRGPLHDLSKLLEPERSIYAERTGKLKDLEYNSPEYHANLIELKPAIEHHYANNRHHPEHWPNGIADMDLVDLMEMLADWAAATKRNKNGNIHKSIDINTPRYQITPQLAQILTNTVNSYF